MLDEMPKRDTPILVGLVYDIDDHELVPNTDIKKHLDGFADLPPWSPTADAVLLIAKRSSKHYEFSYQVIDALKRRGAIRWLAHVGWELTSVGWYLAEYFKRLRGLKR